MDPNQPITTYIRDFFNLLKKGYVSWEVRQSIDGGKNVNVDHILTCGRMFLVTLDNGSEETAGWWQNKTLYETNMSPGCYM